MSAIRDRPSLEGLRWLLRSRSVPHDNVLLRLKRLVAGLFRLDLPDPEKISDDEQIGGRLGLDSVDAVELALGIEEEFGIAICGRDEPLGAFTSIASLADFILARGRTIPFAPRPAVPRRRIPAPAG